MGHTITHTMTEPGSQPASGAETRKPHTIQAPADQSLDHLQAGMVALQKIQEQTARLHEKFLEGQNAATHMLADLLGRSQPDLTTASGARFDESFKTEKAQPPAPEKPLSSELPLKADDSGEDPCQVSPNKRSETPDLRAEISNGARAHVQKVLFEAISETTGYPVEMLEPDMTLDSDLGIDSIKRVEIFSVLREKLPDAPEIEARHLGELETLRDIVDHLAATGEARDQGVNPPPVVAPAADQKAKEGIVKTLLGAISETTGYPTEMLELDMTLDSDLGIDSIKRVEIFSVLREKLPDAPEIEAKHLGELETLQNIVDHLTQVSPKPGVKKDDREGRGRSVSHIFRAVVSCEDIEPALSRGSQVSKTGPIWITRDEGGLCTALQDRLHRMGYETAVISLEDPDRLKPPDALSGLVILGGKDADDGFILNAFKLLQIAEKGLRKRAEDGIKRLVTVSFMDGRFGFGDPAREISPVQGGLAGLSKTARHEWPEVACLALDMNEFGDPRESASTIVSEMFKTGPVERGLGKAHHITLKLIPGPLQTPKNRTLLDPDDVVIVSGGARGITAEVAAAVARACAPVIILLGRSPAPKEGSHRFQHLETESEIKRAIMAAGSGNMTPKTLEKEFRKVMADREINDTLKRLTDLGATVQYHSVDIRNPTLVSEVLADVRNEFGKIPAVIHGAGVLKDRLIGDKTALQFETVYATKVMGLRCLLDATKDDRLKMLALFSSSSARFGRKGQIDYAAANEVLNKMAREEARKRPHCRTVAVNWGPWNGGMVTKALKPLFEEEGIDLIERGAGADYFVNEFGSGEKGPVEVVVMGGAFKEDVLSDKRPQNGLKEPLGARASAFELDLTLDGYPILKDHVMNGNAVLPAAMMIEWLAHGALRNSPEYRFVGFDDFRVFKGIVMENGDSRHLRITAAHVSGNNGTVSLLAEIRGTGNGPLPVLHASAKVVLSNQMPVNGAGRIPLEGLESYSPGKGNIYNDILFHGKRLQNILSAQWGGDDVIMVDLSPTASPASWMHGGTQDRWIADPGAIDGAFQAMILWSFQQCNMGSLPNKIGKYRQFKERFPSKGVWAAARVKERRGHRAVADIEFTDKISGDLVARMEDYECTLDASLGEAFKRRKLG
ncbi:MAG: SDR family NAD(P)-dependent oxidoreductase [Deltaproteobacteria bacterium]|nr:SDR family NAD(P)-dependent oxidoreductase [Deltaproteobacteria bacterium]